MMFNDCMYTDDGRAMVHNTLVSIVHASNVKFVILIDLMQTHVQKNARAPFRT